MKIRIDDLCKSFLHFGIQESVKNSSHKYQNSFASIFKSVVKRKYSTECEKSTFLINKVKKVITDQDDEIKKLFQNSHENEIEKAIEGDGEFVTHDGKKNILWIRKTVQGDVQLLVGEGNSEYESGSFKFVQKIIDLMSGITYAVAENRIKDTYMKFYTLSEAQKSIKIRQKVGEGIIDIHSISHGSERVSILMEYCAGGTFDEYASTKGDNGIDSEYLNKLVEIGNVISKMHAAGWVHSDLHIRNVMLTDTGKIRLIDFGQAREFDFDLDLYENSKNDRTQFAINFLRPTLNCMDQERYQQARALLEKARAGLLSDEPNERLTICEAVQLIKQASQSMSE